MEQEEHKPNSLRERLHMFEELVEILPQTRDLKTQELARKALAKLLNLRQDIVKINKEVLVQFQQQEQQHLTVIDALLAKIRSKSRL